MQKERIKTAANLVEGGAGVTPEGVIIPTNEQIKEAKLEMGEHFYNKLKKTTKTPMGTFPDGKLIYEIAYEIAVEVPTRGKFHKDPEKMDDWVGSFETVEQFLEEAERRVELHKTMDEEKKETLRRDIKEAYTLLEKK